MTGHGSIAARLAAAVEHDRRLDGLVDAMEGPADALTAGPQRDLLLDKPLGHAIHPPMTDLPIGFWTSAWVLDLLPVEGARRASQRLVGLGVLTALPTAVTGWAEWSRVEDRESRRVGVVHAGANSVALALFAGSWLARRSGRHGRGILLGTLGALAASAGGALGGHLAIGNKVGSSFTGHAGSPDQVSTAPD